MTTKTDQEIIENHALAVRHRAKIELTIIHRVIETLRADDYDLSVDDGEEVTTGDDQKLVSAIFEVDEARLVTMKAGHLSFVFFVLGNEGHDVISDYGVSLELILLPIFAWIEEQRANGTF